jgi:DNA-binding MarR family transcriptional regulator
MNITQEHIIRAIAKYKYCTQEQLNQFITLHYQTIYKHISTLVELNLIGKIRYAMPTGRGGSLQYLYHLTNKGARVVSESLRIPYEHIQVPSRNQIMVANDYFHRISTVNSQMSFDRWMNEQGLSEIFFITYFHKGTGSRRTPEQTGKFRSATCLEFPDESHIDPDVILMYEKQDNQKLLYCMEVFNGNDTKRVVTQLKKLLSAVGFGLPSKKYHHNKDSRILATFEHESNMQAVIKRFAEDTTLPKGVINYLFFNLAEKVHHNFGNDWLDLQQNKHNLNEF